MNPIINLMSRSTQDYVRNKRELIHSNSDSPVGYIVPELVFKYGNAGSHFRNFPSIAPWLIHSIINRQKGYKSLKRNSLTPEKKCSNSFVKELETYALSLGCHAIAYTNVPENLIFRNKSILYRQAVVLSMEMNKEEISHAPRIKAGQEVWRTYDRLGAVSNKIARFIRGHGFGAQPGAALGGDTNYPLLAQGAGMGWIGHNGLLLSPGTGASQRLAAVYTSIENLPFFTEENNHEWISDFCGSCRKCSKSCPAGAIYENKPQREDGSSLHIDHRKCAVPFSRTMGCSICIKVCPFFMGDYYKIKSAFTKRSSSRQSGRKRHNL